MIVEKLIFLFKSQKGKNSTDKYEELLVQNGFSVKHAKTLIFNYKNILTLKEKLENADNFEGIIFSSPRCVQAANFTAKNSNLILEKWRTKSNFVVGEESYREALHLLGLDCKGGETGNSQRLSQLIAEGRDGYTKPFLLPHGNLKTDSFTIEMKKIGLEIEEVLVYETIANPNLEKELKELTDNFSSLPEFIIFFSPSGLNSSLDVLRKAPDFDDVKLIAIGPTTEGALKEHNLKIFGTAQKPTPKAVLDVILN